MMYDLVVIGASWGGLHAVGRVLAGVPDEVDLPIVVAQHRHPDSLDATLRGLLGSEIGRPVVDVEDKLPIEAGRVYLAPPDYHLLVERGSFALSVDERVKFARPSIDVLFHSAADAYGAGVIGVILTGANEDGAAGLAEIKERGGVAIIQDPAGAARRAMPDAAIAATVADAVLPLDEIGAVHLRALRPTGGEDGGLVANVLLVDDRPENLVALDAILEPLGQNLLHAGSGEDALRQLLHHEVAVILLDARMPDLDGFETAALIKQRERTKHIPIIFVTAISKDEEHVFRGYSAGAVDYVFKPFDPNVLRSKVAVFIELHEKNEQLRRQAEQLKEQELAELRRESEERYRFLAESQPDQIWTAMPNGRLDYVNQRVLDYFDTSFADMVAGGWPSVVHPDDLPRLLERWQQALDTGHPYENEVRLRRAGDGAYRWHLARALPMHNRRGQVVKWFGSHTDIDDQKRAEEAQRFLVEAGEVLAGSLDYRSTLAAVASLAVPRIADWTRVDVLERDNLRTLAVEHVDPQKIDVALELARRYPEGRDAPHGPPHVLRAERSELVPEITEEMLTERAVDELHLGLARELGFQSYMCVPLFARGRVFGVMSFVSAESGRRYGPQDLALAEELARRAGTAIENAQLYREVEERAQAARVLETVGDGVFLVDQAGVIRLWNRAAEAITALRRADVVGGARKTCFPVGSRSRTASASPEPRARPQPRRCRSSSREVSAGSRSPGSASTRERCTPSAI